MRKLSIFTLFIVTLAGCGLLRAYMVEVDYKVPSRNVVVDPGAPRLKVDVQQVTDTSQYTKNHGQYTPTFEYHGHKRKIKLEDPLSDMVRDALIKTLNANLYENDPSAPLATDGKITSAAISVRHDEPTDAVRAAIGFEIRVFHPESGKTTFTHKYNGDVTVHVRPKEHIAETISRAIQGALDQLMSEFVSKDLQMYRAYEDG